MPFIRNPNECSASEMFISIKPEPLQSYFSPSIRLLQMVLEVGRHFEKGRTANGRPTIPGRPAPGASPGNANVATKWIHDDAMTLSNCAKLARHVRTFGC